ncbi:MAG: HAD family hydrolase [Lentisphaeraceae bacterium]|nr:HAD family hydrolase [Lentisphaeraceae bacterium]
MPKTVFIDRDGVINRRLIDDWVKVWEEFELLDGVPEALSLLKNADYRLILITNQRGIAVNKFTRETLDNTHEKMNELISSKDGAPFDAIYVCPHDRHEKCSCRKPQPGMILQAAQDFQDINLSECVMFGDSESDRGASENAGCKGFYKIDDEHSLLNRVKEYLK